MPLQLPLRNVVWGTRPFTRDEGPGTPDYEKCKTEGVVDVFQVVKALRAQKPGAVPTVVSGCILSMIFTWRECCEFSLFPPDAG